MTAQRYDWGVESGRTDDEILFSDWTEPPELVPMPPTLLRQSFHWPVKIVETTGPSKLHDPVAKRLMSQVDNIIKAACSLRDR